jgi:hypothetical protein
MLFHVWLGKGRIRSVVHFCAADTLKASFLLNPDQPYVQGGIQPLDWAGSHWSMGPTVSKLRDVHRKVWVVEVENSLSSAHLQQNWRTQCFTCWSKSFQISYSNPVHLGGRRNGNMWFTELALGALVSLAVSTTVAGCSWSPVSVPSDPTQ